MKLSSKNKSLGARVRQAGFTLVELSVVMAIAAMLLVAALAGVRKIMDTNNVQTATNQMVAANTNIYKLATNLSDWTAVNSVVGMAQLGAFNPIDLVKNAAGAITGVKNVYGGAVYTAQNSAAVGNYAALRGYFYILTNVPNSSCGELVTSMNSTAAALYVQPGGTTAAAITTAQATPTAATNVKAPDAALVPATVESTCNAVASASKEIWAFMPI